MQRPAYFCLVLFSLMGLTALSGQEVSSSNVFGQRLPDFKVKVSTAFQQWTTYSWGAQVLDSETGLYMPADDRFNIMLRRSRIGFSGQPYSKLDFKLTAALDLVGRDILAATEAGSNNGGSPQFRLWNALVHWQPLLGKSDGLHLIMGYFVSPIGRESMTAAMRSSSFEKAWSQNYLRRHLTGIAPGRSMGFMLGGQFGEKDANFHYGYEVAVQNPVSEALGGNSTGIRSSLLFVGRGVLHFGDPENTTYKYAYKTNHFGKRKGLTIGLSAAAQGKSDMFTSNTAWGGDWNLSLAHLTFDGELLAMGRKGDNGLSTQGLTGYARLGYNFYLPRKIVLEPLVSYWYYRGPMQAAEQIAAQALHSFTGQDNGLDLGLNLYFSPDFKLSLFYASRFAEAGEMGPEKASNNFFEQPGVGDILRGDYIGLGWVGIF